MNRLTLLIILSMLSSASCLCQNIDGERVRARLTELLREEKQLSDSAVFLAGKIEADSLTIIDLDRDIADVEAQIALLMSQKAENAMRLDRISAFQEDDIESFIAENQHYVDIPISKTELSVLNGIITKCESYRSDDTALISFKQDLSARLNTFSAYQEIMSVSEKPYDSLAVRKALADLDELLSVSKDLDRDDFFTLKGYLVNFSTENREFTVFVQNLNSKMKRYRVSTEPDEELAASTAKILMDLFNEKTVLTIPYLRKRYARLSSDLMSSPLKIGAVEQSIIGED